MDSLQERIVAYANLLALSKELDQLRERVKEAEKLSDASKPSSKENPPTLATSTGLLDD